MIYKTKIHFLTNPSDREAVHIGVEVLVNGIDVFMLIDTGASRTVIDHSRWTLLFPKKRTVVNQEPTIGLGSNAIPSSFARINNLTIGGISIRKQQVVLLDLSVVNETFSGVGLRFVDGIIGGDLLLKYKSTIDYHKGWLNMRMRKPYQKRIS